MQPNEPTNFLRLSTALKIFCGSSVKVNMLPHAEALLRDYLLNYKELYGLGAMKPNFHWAVHLRQQILDYGPVYNFWAFLSERLNKVLKGSNSNNWIGGQIEISMMREFARGSQIDSLARGASATTISPIIKALLERMINDHQEALGTVQDAATERESDELNSYLSIQPGPSVLTPQRLSDDARVALYHHYNRQEKKVHYALEINHPHTSSQLNDFALFYQFVLLDGRRLTPLSKTTRESARSSLVKVLINDKSYYGEVINIFSHTQAGLSDGTQLLAEFRWMIELPLSPVEGDPWSEFPELDVMCFKLKEYRKPGDVGSPPSVLPCSHITSQIARGVVDVTNPPMWITTTFDRVREQHLGYALIYSSLSMKASFRVANNNNNIHKTDQSRKKK
ncbi:hypothetical protein PAXINDRAFT_87673 [Paxillus involutus ATCC 200175]|uniref:Uncharacterized protein n=1 Tax=Paxillus involutus ATCC 200175 TaxID=664439 RepID=A0A0C9SPX0_PAXIN|nr:hypothetical protein PAXINDRAFT_87673 [Paxillus involutus ATCC 200175]